MNLKVFFYLKRIIACRQSWISYILTDTLVLMVFSYLISIIRIRQKVAKMKKASV